MKNAVDISNFKQKVLHWANQFEVCCFLDSSQYEDKYSQYDYIIAVGVDKELSCQTGNAFDELKHFYNAYQQWMFGLFCYDLKNEIENLSTLHKDSLKFPDLYFFIPKYLITSKNNKIEVLIGDNTILQDIENQILLKKTSTNKLDIKSKISKTKYLEKVNQLKKHIVRGDIYEVNFCQEFFAEHAAINPLQTYEQLSKISPSPFAGYFKIYDKYILSATPERFLCKRGNQLISQPIKGTAKRTPNLLEDEQIKISLKNDLKEQAENVMIVDLVRNDLTKSAVQGSVKVAELFGIYSFPQVHQMISTITCQLSPDIHFIDAIKNTFPMGSMTGAPKLSAMKLIDHLEESKRGAYSGSMGCISPNGDFDFNVIIRSIMYNANTKYLSFQVGGAITYNSDAEKEYEECLVKASAIFKVLSLSDFEKDI